MRLSLRLITVGLLCAAPTASVAEAADTPARTMKLPDLEWAKTAGPKDANGRQIPSRAVVRCKIDAVGTLSACRTIKETPEGSGAGDALIAAAPRYAVAPAMRGWVPVDSEFSLVVNWFETDTDPKIRRKPKPTELYAAYPKAALAEGLSGRGRINCLVSADGKLFDCEPLGEDPEGSGFAAAVMALAPLFEYVPATKAGRPVLSATNLPITFRAPPRPVAAVPSLPEASGTDAEMPVAEAGP